MVLRPAAVSGTRRVGGGVSLPLSLVMDPARRPSRDGVGGARHAPVPLDNVARAAARAALDFECETFDRGFSVVSNASLITEDYYNLLKRKPAWTSTKSRALFALAIPAASAMACFARPNRRLRSHGISSSCTRTRRLGSSSVSSSVTRT